MPATIGGRPGPIASTRICSSAAGAAASARPCTISAPLPGVGPDRARRGTTSAPNRRRSGEPAGRGDSGRGWPVTAGEPLPGGRIESVTAVHSPPRRHSGGKPMMPPTTTAASTADVGSQSRIIVARRHEPAASSIVTAATRLRRASRADTPPSRPPTVASPVGEQAGWSRPRPPGSAPVPSAGSPCVAAGSSGGSTPQISVISGDDRSGPGPAARATPAGRHSAAWRGSRQRCPGQLRPTGATPVARRPPAGDTTYRHGYTPGTAGHGAHAGDRRTRAARRPTRNRVSQCQRGHAEEGR